MPRTYSKEYYQANKERMKARSIAWQRANPEKVKAKSKAYRDANPDKIAATKKAWVKANREKQNAYNKKYRQANKDKCLDYSRKWRKANPEKYHGYDAQRRQRECEICTDSDALSQIAAIYDSRDRVAACLGADFHVDHTIPLSQGGTHTPDNLEVVPAIWNLAKNNLNHNTWRRFKTA